MWISYTIFLVTVLSGILAMPSPSESDPTAFPILRPESFALVSNSTEENLDAIVVEAATGRDDGEAIEGTTEGSGSESSEGKEFDPSDCFLTKARGPCRAVIDSWFFNVGTKTCEPFIYSGCRGNNNRFKERAECESRCAQPKPQNSTTENSTTTTTTTTLAPSPTSTTQKPRPKLPDCPKFEGCSDKCVIIQDRSDRGCKKCLCSTQPSPSEGMDKKIVTTSGNSTSVIATGSVSGLPANASTEEDEAPILGSPNEICNQPVTRGDCRAMLTRYRYDPKTKNCVQFHFGGCEGNGNNFVSKEKCIAYCKGQ